MNTWKHMVCTYNENGDCIYEHRFMLAEDAYDEYVCIVNNLKKMHEVLRKRFPTTVIRFNDGHIMSMETVC